jgi:hypothetical protein
VIVTGVPGNPDAGDKFVITGGANTVKLTPLLATPFTATTTFPEVAAAGTVAVMLFAFALQEVTLAGVPLKVTVLVPCAGPNPVPAMVIDVPTESAFGERLLILGRTVNLTPLLARPPTLTNTLPVVAVLGTATVMLPLLQVLGVATAPLKTTVLVPWVEPNPLPLIVTEVPTWPEVGFRPVMLGGVPVDGGLMVTAIELYEVLEVKLAVSVFPDASVVILYSVSPPLPSIAPRL